MATRLAHSPGGFLRSMQVSRYRLWVMVEGPIDRTLYDSICGKNANACRVGYRVILAQEIPGYRGNGKQALLVYYRYLRRRGALLSDLGGKKTGVLFILDKDIDDLLRRRARSSHVLYTEWYSAENYLFRFGDLCVALRMAAHLDAESVANRLNTTPQDWARKAAHSWKEWITYCVFVRRHKLTLTNYGSSSQFHQGPYEPLDSARHSAALANLRSQLGLAPTQFDPLYRVTIRFVDRMFARNRFDRLFNGKWYKQFLVVDARHAAAGRQYPEKALADRILSTLLSTMDYSAPWSARFHKAIDSIAQSLS